MVGRNHFAEPNGHVLTFLCRVTLLRNPERQVILNPCHV
jgi:hypothetical protein